MRIAVTYEEEKIYWHFGQTERFKLYDVVQGEIAVTAVVNMNGNNHQELVNLLRQMEVETVICGGIGEGAKQAMEQAGIAVYFGIEGSCDDAVEQLLQGNLCSNENNRCQCTKNK